MTQPYSQSTYQSNNSVYHEDDGMLLLYFGAVAVFFMLGAWTMIRYSNAVSFSDSCENYLYKAGKSPDSYIAQKNLGTALTYMEKNHMDTGSTHLFYASAETDLSFFYDNLDKIYVDLGNEDAIVRQNALNNLRAFLMSNGKVVTPPNISIFPSQLPVFVLLAVALMILLCTFMYGVQMLPKRTA